MNEQRGGVNKVAGNIHVCFLQMFDIAEKLCGDLCDRDVIDVDILLADQVQQQVERPVIDRADTNGKGKDGLLVLALVLS